MRLKTSFVICVLRELARAIMSPYSDSMRSRELRGPFFRACENRKTIAQGEYRVPCCVRHQEAAFLVVPSHEAAAKLVQLRPIRVWVGLLGNHFEATPELLVLTEP